MYNVCLCPEGELLRPDSSAPEETVGSGHNGEEQDPPPPTPSPITLQNQVLCSTKEKNPENEEEKNSLRVESLGKLLLLTVLIAFDYVVLDTLF